jgi:hypothetical protein
MMAWVVRSSARTRCCCSVRGAELGRQPDDAPVRVLRLPRVESERARFQVDLRPPQRQDLALHPPARTTALDTQTATSDILRVISRSQTDVQPVFDAILASAIRLLGASTGALTRIAGDQIGLAALTSIDDAGDAALRATFPQSLQSDGPHAQVVRDRAPLNIADRLSDPRVSEAWRAIARAHAWKNSGSDTARVVFLYTPAAAGGYVEELLHRPGPMTDDERKELRERYR